MTSSILIVEDESIVARDIQECLLSFGYKVTGVVSSGEEAIKAVTAERPDLVLMDIVLNGNVDGIDAAHEIRTRFGVPVVYLTAYADDKTLERAKVTEPFGYIVKPFDERELHSTVEIALYKAKSEKKLKESEIWFSTTLKSLGDGVIATDPEGEVVFLNHAAEGITGWRQQDAVGRSMHEIFHIINEHTRQRVENPVAKVLHEGRVVGLANHTILITRQGTEVPIDDSAAPIRDDKGNLLGIVMVFREIIKRKKAEKALAAEKELLSVTLRSIGDGLITTDTRGRVMLVNEKAEQLCGWRQDEALDKPVNEIFKIVNEKNRQELENPVEIVLRTGSTTPLINNTLLISRDGTERIIAEKGAPIRDLDDTVVGVVLIFRDITPERRMEEELEKARKIKSLGILAGGIAHDFNNILTAVIGNISLAKANASPETKYYECLGNAEKAGLRARDLTQQLITFSKGGAPLMRSASIEEIIRDTAQFVLQGANVSSSFSFADDLLLCEIDEGQVSQVISNLVINANQAMPEGGIISIAAENMTVGKGANLPLKQGKYVKITVADHGEGISPENLPKIFDPYFSTKQAGSGIGLATSYSIIRRHRGLVTVESVLGDGTTFYIYLPASDAKSVAQGSEVTGLTKGKGRILVMDDEEIVREVVEQMLVYLGYEVVFVADGSQAIERYRESRESGASFDLVILDLTVPGGMGGKETMEHLLKIDPEVKVLVSSGYSTDPVMAEYRKFGFSGVIGKPYEIKTLGDALSLVLRK